MSETKTYYRPGLRFKARQGALCHQECCFKGAEEVRNADGSLRTEEIRPLWAEFGTYGGEYRPSLDGSEPLNDLYDGHPLVFADIRGGFFDLDVQAEEKGWSDTEKEVVARHMLRKLNEPDCQFTMLEATRVAAPWPTYDSMHHNKIPVFAADSGLIPQALAYELQNKKRESVIEKLRELAAAPATDDESLIAA